MSLEQFREKVKKYRQSTGFTQKSLAQKIGLHSEVLSRKLNGLGTTQLNLFDVKKIITTLVDWKALSTCEQVIELLSFLNFQENSFNLQEWEDYPLNLLIKTPSPAELQSSKLPASAARLPVFAANFHFNNLPAQVTSLVGRAGLLKQAGQLLARPATRLLTLFGPGGSGKTRLAIELGHSLAGTFEQGVCFVNLDGVADPAWVGSTIAKTLGFSNPDTPAATRNLEEFLRDQQLLLILDNFEQVTGATSLISNLLAACPALKILVTSRVVLHLYGEQEFRVPPLAVPQLTEGTSLDSAALFEYAAVQLFVERARAVDADFVLDNRNCCLVASICRELDGLPLALELAATRVKVLSLPVLLENLMNHKLEVLTGGVRNLPVRQQTLRKTLEWSYNLLAPDEQFLLRRLGAFKVGFSLEAVLALYEVTAGSALSPKAALLEKLEILLDKSLIVAIRQPEKTWTYDFQSGNLVRSARFNMLDTIRTFAFEQLNTQREAEQVRFWQLKYYRKLVEVSQDRLNGPDLTTWLQVLDEEHDNLRMLLEYLLEKARTGTQAERYTALEIGLEMAGNLTAYWDIRGYYLQGQTFLNYFLEMAGKLEDFRYGPGYAWGLNRAGIMAGRQGDFELAQRLLGESLELHRHLPDRRRETNTLNYQGVFSFLSGNYPKALVLHSESLAICRQLGYDHGIALALTDLGVTHTALGHYAEAAKVTKEALDLFNKEDNPRGIVCCMDNLGVIASRQGDYATALTYHNECLKIETEQGDFRNLTYTLRYLGDIAFYQQNYLKAYDFYLQCFNYSYRIGDKAQQGTILALFSLVLIQMSNALEAKEHTRLAKEVLVAAVKFMGAGNATLEKAGAMLNAAYQRDFKEAGCIALSLAGENDFNNTYKLGAFTPAIHLIEQFETVFELSKPLM